MICTHNTIFGIFECASSVGVACYAAAMQELN
jgi:hypothetical protein